MTDPTLKTAGAGHRTPAPAPDAAVEDAPAAAPGARPPSRVRGNTGTSRSPGRGVPAQTSSPAQADLTETAPTRTRAGEDSDRAAGPRRRGSGSPIDPPTGVLPRDSAPAGGATPLRGKDFRDAVKAAESRLHAAQRNARGRFPRQTTTPRPKPGMNRRMPRGTS